MALWTIDREDGHAVRAQARIEGRLAVLTCGTHGLWGARIDAERMAFVASSLETMQFMVEDHLLGRVEQDRLASAG